MKKVITKLGAPVKRSPKVKKPEYKKPLKFGDKGAEVQYMSVCLALKGSRIKPVEDFHIGMRSAVVAFQKRNNLKPTGIIDKKTWMKLTEK